MGTLYIITEYIFLSPTPESCSENSVVIVQQHCTELPEVCEWPSVYSSSLHVAFLKTSFLLSFHSEIIRAREMQ